MRQDKLTTKFQEALGDAQTLALGNDNAYIEAAHLLTAMLRQEDGPRAMLERSGANVAGLLQAAEAAIKKLPQVQGHQGFFTAEALRGISATTLDNLHHFIARTPCHNLVAAA